MNMIQTDYIGPYDNFMYVNIKVYMKVIKRTWVNQISKLNIPQALF